MDDSNPYQTPASDSQGKHDRQKVRMVAAAQRMVLMAVLANIGIWASALFTSRKIRVDDGWIAFTELGGQSAVARGVFLIVALAVIGFMIFAMYNLAKRLNSHGLAIFYAILMIVPCISLIMLMFVSQQATEFLKGHGIKVGLMGANMNQFN